MGRPINKRYLGAGSGDQIRVTAKLPGEAEGDGFIVSQRATRKFRVNINGVEGVCKLVNKDSGTLADSEMIINVTDNTGTTVQATKLHNRLAIVEGNQKKVWSFDAVVDSVDDVDIADAVSATISIDVQPLAQTTVGGSATYDITASVVPAGVVTYQWQERQGAGNYVNIVDGGDYAGATTASFTLSNTVDASRDAWTYRCVVSSDGADSVTSSTASLTFGS